MRGSILKQTENKIKLVVLYFRRIVFVKNNFKVSPFIKIKANIRGYLADQYVLFDLDRNRYDSYLSEFDWYKSRFINQPFEDMLNNKLVCNDVIKTFAKTPEILFIKTYDIMMNVFSEPVSSQYIIDTIKQQGSCYIKPINAGKGTNVYRIDYEDGFLLDGQQTDDNTIEKLLCNHNYWFISRTSFQTEYLNNFFPHSTNTMRIITLKDIVTQEWEIYFAIQRFGTNASIPVDNASRGGLIAKIDIETGELSKATTIKGKEWYDSHPNSGVKIEGFVIPKWDDIKTSVLEMARQMPYLNFIAWDLLITDDGIVVIEANNSSGVNIIQVFGGEKKGKLGNFYRHYKVIK